MRLLSAHFVHRNDTRDMPSGEPALSRSIPPTRWSVDELIPFGKYVLLNKISAGATAAVYRAKIRGEAGFERLVTIKRILPQMAGDPEFVETFVREAKVCARLNHSNICPIYELGKVGESLYMASEWVAGKDLRAVTKRLQRCERVMPPLAAAWIASRLCDALDYAHGLKDANGERLNILHQDLSPANIVLSYDGAVKLLDFGIARATGRAQQTNVDALKQKLGYMSPELVLGTPVDRRSDLFGVGVCLYEMVTGKRLFAGSDDIATLKLLRNATVPPPSALRGDTPEELEHIIMRALARDPEGRWPSAGEMAHALTAFVTAEDPTFGTRNLEQLMQELFEDDKKEEQTKLHELLTASQDAQLLEQRRRFFASPQGAAAIAKAEATRRLASTRPPPAPSVSAMAVQPDQPANATQTASSANARSKAPANTERSVTDSHVSERRTQPQEPREPQESAASTQARASLGPQGTEEDDDELTTYRPTVIETPRPGAVARNGLTTAATYNELIRRSGQGEGEGEGEDAEPTMYRAEPSVRLSRTSEDDAALSKQEGANDRPTADPLHHGLGLEDLQNEQTVFELDPADYDPLPGDQKEQDAKDRAQGPDATRDSSVGSETRSESESEDEVDVDFESEATHYREPGLPARPDRDRNRDVNAAGLSAPSGADYEEEATHIFFSAEDGIELPDVPDDELTTVSPPTPLRVPPAAGVSAAISSRIPVPAPTGRPSTGARAPIASVRPSARAAEPTLPKLSTAPQPRSSLAERTGRIISSIPPRTQNGLLIWGIAALVLVTLTALIVRTPLGITLGLRKPTSGIIEVRTSPEVPATVRLDEIYRGRAPLRLEGVPAGVRVIKLQADGYEDVTRTVNLEGGSVLHESITLQPVPSAPSPIASP